MLDTIVLTTKQWEESAYQYTAIKKGVLCIELTNDDKMMAKMGIGNKYYQELPYLTFDIGSIQIDLTELKKQTAQNTNDISNVELHLTDIDVEIKDINDKIPNLIFSDKSKFPTIGDVNSLYITTDTNLVYRYDKLNKYYISVSGTSQLDKNFVFTQSISSDVWQIKHSLNK